MERETRGPADKDAGTVAQQRCARFRGRSMTAFGAAIHVPKLPDSAPVHAPAAKWPICLPGQFPLTIWALAADHTGMSPSQRTLGAAPVALGLLLIAVMSAALAALGGAGAWIVALLGGTVLGVLVVLAGVSILGVSKAV